MAVNEAPAPVRKRAPALYAIIAIKLGKGLLLFCLGVGIYSLLDDNLQAEFNRLVRYVGLDPDQRLLSAIGARIQAITPSNLRWLASTTLLYSLLLFIEGGGLIYRAAWAAWLAIGETAFFIPLEVFKLAEKFSFTLLLVLVVNVAIVWYLVANRSRLFRHHH